MLKVRSCFLTDSYRAYHYLATQSIMKLYDKTSGAGSLMFFLKSLQREINKTQFPRLDEVIKADLERLNKEKEIIRITVQLKLIRDKKYAHIDYKNAVGESIPQGILFTDEIPKLTTLNELKIKAQQGYIVTQKDIFYVNKEINFLERLSDISPKKLNSLLSEFKKITPGYTEILSEEKLIKISAITGYNYPRPKVSEDEMQLLRDFALDIVKKYAPFFDLFERNIHYLRIAPAYLEENFSLLEKYFITEAH